MYELFVVSPKGNAMKISLILLVLISILSWGGAYCAQMELPRTAVLGEEITLALTLDGAEVCLVFTPYEGGEAFTYSCFFRDGTFPIDTGRFAPGSYLVELREDADGEILDSTILIITTEPVFQLTDIYTRPNPFDLTATNPRVEFVNVPPWATVRIFDLGGELVINLTGNPILWDGRNQDGDFVSAGSYIYLVEDESGNEFVGKMAVLK
ncbi:hypothetical protein ES703_36911 [subsurface metagenome]